MVFDKISSVISKAVIAEEDNNYGKESILIKDFYEAINKNQNLLDSASGIDVKNENGFMLDYSVFDTIFDKYKDVTAVINNHDEILKYDGVVASQLYKNLGIVLVMFDGNPYTMVELIILGFLTHNKMVFVDDGYMGGTNGLLITFAQTVLESYKINRNVLQHVMYINAKEIFKNNKSIAKTFIIGDNDFVSKYLKDCNTEVEVSGYNNYDLYIESLDHKELIDKILKLPLNLSVYVREDIELDYEDVTIVSDVDEAISMINYSGSGYSASIFTSDETASGRFISQVNSETVMVNTSPTIERSLDITQEQLLRTKKVILPKK